MGLFFKRKNKTKEQEKTDGRPQTGNQGQQTGLEEKAEEAGQTAPVRTRVTDSKGEYLWNSIDDFSRSSNKEVRSSLQIPGFYMGSGKNLPEMSQETTEELLADIRSGSTEVHIEDMRYSRTREDFEPARSGRRRRSSRKKDTHRQEAESVSLSAEEKYAISRGKSGLNSKPAEQDGGQTGHSVDQKQLGQADQVGINPARTDREGKTPAAAGQEGIVPEAAGQEGKVPAAAGQGGKAPAVAGQEEKTQSAAGQEEKAPAAAGQEGRGPVIASGQQGQQTVSGKAGIEELRPQEAGSADQDDGGDPDDQILEKTGQTEVAGQVVAAEEDTTSGLEDDYSEDEDDESGDMDSAGRSILSMVVSLALVGLVMIFVFSFKTFLKGRTYHKPEMSAELGLEDQYQAGNQYLQLDPSFLSSYIVIKEMPQEGLSEDLIPGKKTNSSVPVASGQILRASGRGTYENKTYYQLENGMYITANGINVEPLKLYVPVTGSLAITHVSSKGVKLRRWPDFKSKTNIEKYVFVGDVVNVVSRLVLADGQTGAYVTDEGLYIVDDQKYFEPHVNDPTRPETSGETQEAAGQGTE